MQEYSNKHSVCFIRVHSCHMGLDARKPVFGVSDKSETQPVSTATETCLKIEILLVALSLDMILSKKRIKKADAQAGLRLCFQTLKSGFLPLRPI